VDLWLPAVVALNEWITPSLSSLTLSGALTEKVRQRKLPVVPGARISEVPLDQGVKAETFVQLAREQQPGIGSDGGSEELDAELRIEREANRARCRVTHWAVPSA